jgi:hypothetical protein
MKVTKRKLHSKGEVKASHMNVILQLKKTEENLENISYTQREKTQRFHI